MYLYFIIACFIATFLSIHGLPLKSKSVYEMIKLSGSDPHFKCPYVRTTKLLEPEPEVLSKCVNFTAAQSLTTLKLNNVQDGLCILYYDNFERLCFASNNYSEVAKRLLSNDEIDQIPTTYQNVSRVCATLKNTQGIVVENSQPGIDVVRRHFEDIRKCQLICTDLDLSVKPICSLTAFMMNVTSNLYKETQNVVPADTKNEKVKKKPVVNDHNADNQDASSNKQLHFVEKKQNTDEAPQSGLPTNKNIPLQNIEANIIQGQSSGTQNQLPIIQNPISQNNLMPNTDPRETSNFEHKDPVLPDQKLEEHNDNYKQSAAPNIQPTLSGAATNMQDEKPYVQSNIEIEAADLQPTVTPKNIKTVKDEEELNPAVNTEQKPEAPQLSNNPNSDSKNNNEVVQQSGDTKPQNNDSKQPEVDGQLQQLQSPLNRESPIEKPVNGDTKNNQDAGTEDQDNKQATKVDEDIEVAGEPPQDANNKDPLLDDSDGDADAETLLGNDPDYNTLSDFQVPPSEVKPKLAEKSKPLEIDEDGPSFAANYQNQSIDDSDSYFFSYFMMVCIMFICGYVAYHNKQKILALVVEGRKGRRPSRTRRPNSANYRKLDSNLEEAVTSSCNKNPTQVIY